MDSYKPIECASYDILEIICMDGYDVEVTTQSENIAGIADTLKKQDDGEYLILKTSETEQVPIRADQINKIDVLTRPCRFTSFDFR